MTENVGILHGCAFVAESRFIQFHEYSDRLSIHDVLMRILSSCQKFLLDLFGRGNTKTVTDFIQDHYTDVQEYFADVTPPQLTEDHLKNSRILPNRESILHFMPKRGVCAEVGTQTGSFAKKILQIMSPRQLHIYDIDFTPFDIEYFQASIKEGKVELHRGDSSTLLGMVPDGYFDFVYVDADHSYAGVVKDLQQAVKKVNDNGWIVCNDYTVYDPSEKQKYGVCRAVNELCLNHNWEIVYLGLHRWGFHDVALRRRVG